MSGHIMNTIQRKMLISRLSAITPAQPANLVPQMFAMRAALEDNVNSIRSREAQLKSQLDLLANERVRIEDLLSRLVAKIDSRQRETLVVRKSESPTATADMTKVARVAKTKVKAAVRKRTTPK